MGGINHQKWMVYDIAIPGKVWSPSSFYPRRRRLGTSRRVALRFHSFCSSSASQGQRWHFSFWSLDDARFFAGKPLLLAGKTMVSWCRIVPWTQCTSCFSMLLISAFAEQAIREEILATFAAALLKKMMQSWIKQAKYVRICAKSVRISENLWESVRSVRVKVTHLII